LKLEPRADSCHRKAEVPTRESADRGKHDIALCGIVLNISFGLSRPERLRRLIARPYCLMQKSCAILPHGRFARVAS
jgi:hypothetical protein